MGIDNMVEDNVVYFKNLTSVYWKAFMIQEKKSKEYYNEDMHAIYSLGFFFFSHILIFQRLLNCIS